ncbi:nucleotidyltransferase family protein [Gilvimarinus polysaccharolyticus]|uniref:nucleotidyltransferase family protein n=1 Tax=Gilvimarinus polysaccharolyticus TaxID=863921 RepID=UPI001E5CB3F9|nr:nucleotidyltransferase family protein [Gilvimarinus polysaccharolyticus]
MNVLSITRSLNLPDCYVAAGFLRNLVWDSMHLCETELNDIDIVFFDKSDLDNFSSNNLTEQLNKEYPGINWEVKNQAFMHIKNGDLPYKNTLDAMSYWPEKETAIGASLNEDDTISIVSVFGLESLFSGNISYNGKRSKEVFLNRVASKQWLKRWPKLRVVL